MGGGGGQLYPDAAVQIADSTVRLNTLGETRLRPDCFEVLLCCLNLFAGSRPSSAAGRSRPGSSAAVRGVDSLAAVPEESAGGAVAAAAAYSPGPPGVSLNGWRKSSVGGAATAGQPVQQPFSGQLAKDGLAAAGTEAAAEESQQVRMGGALLASGQGALP